MSRTSTGAAGGGFPLGDATQLPLTGEAHPLNREFVRWMSWSNGIVVLLGLALFLLYALLSAQKTTEPVARSVRIVRYTDLGVPPSIARPAPPQLNVAQAVAPPSIGVPEPVPIVEAETPTIATQTEMSEALPDPTATGFGSGTGDSLVIEGEPGGVVDELPAPDDFVLVESEPERLRMDPPVYPKVAIDAGVEGTVIVQALVSKEGKVLRARALDGPQMLHDAAIACAKTAVFRPALTQNKPVDVWVVMPITFRLRQ